MDVLSAACHCGQGLLPAIDILPAKQADSNVTKGSGGLLDLLVLLTSVPSPSPIKRYSHNWSVALLEWM